MKTRIGLALVAAVLGMIGTVGTALAIDPVATLLAGKEQRLEALYADYWRTESRIALGSAHLSSRPIQDQIRSVADDPEFVRELEASRSPDPLLQRRRELFLEQAIGSRISADPELSALIESITRDEANHRFLIGGKRLARAELDNLIAHEPDRALRREAWEARAQIAAVTGERIRRAMRLRNALSRRHARQPFPEFMLRSKGIDRDRLSDWFEQIRTGMEGEYRRLISLMHGELHVERVEPWDVDYYFATLTGDFEQERFAPERGWPTVKQVAASLGYDLDHLPVEMTIADITFGGATYPILYGREVRILVNRRVGITLAETLLHETGHALHYSFIDEPSFLLRSHSAEPLDEGLGQVMALLLYRPEIGAAHFGLTPEQARSLAERHRRQSLFALREALAESRFEFAAYEDPDGDLAALYNRICSEHLGLDLHGAAVWAYNPFYASGPIYLQSYVLAEMVAWQIHRAIDRRFGRDWGRDAGVALRERFFSRGGRLPLDGIMRSGTGEPLTARYLIEAIQAAGPKDSLRGRPQLGPHSPGSP